MNKILKRVFDDSYEIEFNFDKDPSHIDIKVWRISCIIKNSKTKSFEYPKLGSNSSDDTTSDKDLAELALEGFIKWDGCSNLTMFPSNKGHEHFCGMDSLKTYLQMLEFLYQICSILLNVEKKGNKELYGLYKPFKLDKDQIYLDIIIRNEK